MHLTQFNSIIHSFIHSFIHPTWFRRNLRFSQWQLVEVVQNPCLAVFLCYFVVFLPVASIPGAALFPQILFGKASLLSRECGGILVRTQHMFQSAKNGWCRIIWINAGNRKYSFSLGLQYKDISSLGRILNIRLPSVKESLSKGILLLRVSHWDVVIIP